MSAPSHDDDGGPAADRAHAAHAMAVATGFAPLLAMGNDILKAVALLNGGAAVATLLMLSRSLRDDRALALALVWPLSAFGFGLTVAAFATGWSYIAQASHAEGLKGRALTLTPPYVVDTAASAAEAERGERYRRLALGAVLVAMASAVGGFALAGAALITSLR